MPSIFVRTREKRWQWVSFFAFLEAGTDSPASTPRACTGAPACHEKGLGPLPPRLVQVGPSGCYLTSTIKQLTPHRRCVLRHTNARRPRAAPRKTHGSSSGPLATWTTAGRSWAAAPRGRRRTARREYVMTLGN